MRSTLRRGVVVAVGAAAALSLGFGSAMADPNLDNAGGPLAGGFLPDGDDLVGTGSDTIQYVTNELSRGYDDGGVRLASFNAFQPGTEANPVTDDDIEIRPGVIITRPNGSSDGINELLANPDVDFARSSRPSDGLPDEDTLSFVPFALDGLGYIVDDATFVPDNLTDVELEQIYTCQLGGFAAKIPQAGSGTRTFFLGQINVSEAEVAQAIEDGCVEEVQEHDAAAVDGDPTALAPFSTARYEVNPVDPNNPPSANVSLASGAGVFQVERLVYHVIRDADWTNPARTDLQNVFGPSGLVCTALAAPGGYQGFDGIGAACGVAVADV